MSLNIKKNLCLSDFWDDGFSGSVFQLLQHQSTTQFITATQITNNNVCYEGSKSLRKMSLCDSKCTIGVEINFIFYMSFKVSFHTNALKHVLLHAHALTSAQMSDMMMQSITMIAHIFVIHRSVPWSIWTNEHT